jgi:hypothetical protein
MRMGLIAAAVLMLSLAPLVAMCEHGAEGHIEVLGFCHARAHCAESDPSGADRSGPSWQTSLRHEKLFDADLLGAPRIPGLPVLTLAFGVSAEPLSPCSECAAPSGKEASGPPRPGIALLHCTLLL